MGIANPPKDPPCPLPRCTPNPKQVKSQLNGHASRTHRTGEYESDERAADEDDPLGACDERADHFREGGKEAPLGKPTGTTTPPLSRYPHRPHRPHPHRALRWLPRTECLRPRWERHSRRQGQRIKVEAVRLDVGARTGLVLFGVVPPLPIVVVRTGGSVGGGGRGVVLALDSERRVGQRRSVDPVHVFHRPHERDIYHALRALRDVDADPPARVYVSICNCAWIRMWWWGGSRCAALELVEGYHGVRAIERARLEHDRVAVVVVHVHVRVHVDLGPFAQPSSPHAETYRLGVRVRVRVRVRARVEGRGDPRLGELVRMQLADVAEEEDDDAHALEAREEREEAHPEHRNACEAARARHVGDVRAGVGIGAGGEHREDDEEAAARDEDYPH